MAECILLKSGSSIFSDDCTATKANVEAGKTALTKDSDDEIIAGTLRNVTSDTTIYHASNNSTPVIIGDAAYVSNNTDGITRAEIRFGGARGVIESNTLIGVSQGVMATAGGLTASKLLKNQSAFGLAGTATSDATAAASHILSGKTAYVNGSKVTGSIASLGAQTITPGNTQKVVSCSGKYMTGNVTVPAVTNLIAANIKKGVNVGGVVGTFEGWVPVATDLYYNGQNPAGLTLGSGFVFENTQIKMKSVYGQEINFTRAYNVQSFSKLVLEGNLGVKPNTPIRLVDNAGKTLVSIYVNSVLSSLQLDIAQVVSIPSGSYIDFNSSCYATTYIKRIRLA